MKSYLKEEKQEIMEGMPSKTRGEELNYHNQHKQKG